MANFNTLIKRKQYIRLGLILWRAMRQQSEAGCICQI